MQARPNLSIIAALADNRVIGRGNALPWRLPADLARFKRLTLGKPILMGRRTWESLPGLLPHRTHVVLTRAPGYQAAGAEVVHSVQAALDLVGAVDELMVIGGGELYAQCLPLASRMYLTLVHAAIEGDTLFPAYDPAEWEETAREEHPADERHAYPYSFVDLRRLP